MSTIKSSAEDLTLNADGSNEIKFQINAVEKASISSAGLLTSTTIDATALTGNLPAIDGSSLTGVGGKVLQAVTAIDDTSRNTTSTTYVTGSNTLTVDITPATTSSRILILMNSVGGHATTNGSVAYYTIYRDSTDIGPANGNGLQMNYAGSSDIRTSVNISVLDSPSTTSQITYQVYFKEDGASGQCDLNWSSGRGTITAIEIGA